MSVSRDPDARLAALLCDRSVFGLEADEQVELEALLEAAGVEPDPSLELAAAAIERAVAGPVSEMPEGLADRLVASFPAERAPRPARPSALVLGLELAPEPEPRPAPANDEPPRGGARWGWPLAAAAAALLGLAAGAALGPTPAAPAVVAEAPAEPAPTPGAPATPAEARADLLVRADDLVRIEWSVTEDVAARGTKGDIVWSPSLQRGFMRFNGLAANDPRRARYQLWIFDETRDERYPVDGGLFDVQAQEVVVPIEAKLPVGAASLFAVTVEPPTGVVVSDRERIVLTAKPTPAPSPTPGE